MLMIFSILFDNYKVVYYEVIFIVTKYHNCFPSGFMDTKRISCSATVMTRLEYFV